MRPGEESVALVPKGAVFHIKRVSKSTESNHEGVCLVGKFLSSENGELLGSSEDFAAIADSLLSIRHTNFLADGDEKGEEFFESPFEGTPEVGWAKAVDKKTDRSEANGTTT